MWKYILLFFFLFTGVLGISAQDDIDFDPPAEDDEEELVIDSIPNDSIELTEEELLAKMSPDERWLYLLRKRMDNVLGQFRFTKVTTKTGKGKRAKRVTRTVASKYKIGVNVYDLTADSTIYSHNERELYIPASNQKLFVSIAALSSIGADYPFSTQIYLDGQQEIDLLKKYVVQRDTSVTDAVVLDTLDVIEEERPYWKGNVYVWGGFDPTLDKTSATFVAGKFMGLDVDSIAGQIYCYEPQKQLTSNESWFWQKHPSKTFPQALYTALWENGVSFASSSPYGTLSNPMDFKGVELTSLSTPLNVVLKRMMKNSDNYYAESMLLNLCDLRDTDKWSYEACKQQVRDMVKRAGGQPNEYIIADGSGLSHSNKATPVVVTDILRYAYHTPEVYEPLYESLPIAGVDGTLGSRMRNSAAYRNVRAKTGTVSGVSTLSGYATASNGHVLAFSILVNNVSTSVGRQMQNLLCIEMAR